MEESAIPPDEPEVWLPVVDYEGSYAVSNLGRVQSFLKWRGKSGRILRQALTGPPTQRLCVVLYKDGKARTRLVHQLVLESFAGPRPQGCESLHGPRGPFVNHLTNLSWGTRKQNMADKLRDGTSVRGEQQWQATLTEANVIECRRRYAAGEYLTTLASEYGVTQATLSDAAAGRTWAWVPGAVPVDTSRHGQKGDDHYIAKLTGAIVLECRRRHASGETTYALAKEFGVSQVAMSAATRGKTWKHI